MTDKNELETRVKQLEAALRRLGVPMPREPGDKPNPDFVQHGSAAHAALIGLVDVTDPVQTKKDGHITYTSAKTGKTYRLEDQITPFMNYPDPGQVANLVLQQKVSAFESGPPSAPKDAPPLWTPETV